MPTIRHTFLTPPTIGDTYHIGTRSYDILDREAYTRRQDGEASALFTWRTACEECNDLFTFKTGPTSGDVQTRCKGCRAVWWREIDARRRRLVSDEIECNSPASIVDIYRALQTVQGSKPQPMSLANNASRRLFAPLLLREAYAPLSEHTVAEILAGIHEALRRGLVLWQAVGRYKCGHPRKGLVARPEALLRANGWWPVDDGVFA